jgi:Zn-dependent metalloprotease
MAIRPFRLILFAILFVALLGPAVLNRRASAQESVPGGWSGEAPAGADRSGLAQTVPGASQLAYNDQTGLLRFIGTMPGQVIPQPEVLPPGTSPEAAALSFLGVYGELFGLKDPANELSTLAVESGENGHTYVHFQQTYQDTPVMGGELIVQMDEKQNIASVNGEVLPTGVSLPSTTAVAADVAIAAAKAAVAKEYGMPEDALTTSEPEVWVYSPAILGSAGDQANRLVWRMEVTPADLQPVRELVLVDAQKGSVVLSINQIDAAMVRQVYNNENDYTRGLPGSGGIVRAEGQGETGNADVDRAYDYSGNTYDFYLNVHGRDSLDGLGMSLISTVNYCFDSFCTGEPNPDSFWNGAQAVFRQGFALTDDIVAHELTHGVTENESNLFNYMQSGAVSESFSDIWGEYIDQTYDGPNDKDTEEYRWYIGEDIPGGAIRNMANPPEFGDPDKMSSANYYCGSSDNGGVHRNSGVGNKAAFLITDGGTFNGYNISPIAPIEDGIAARIEKAAKIFYEVQTHMLTSAADYRDLAEALSQACNNLIGTSGITSYNCTQVRQAIAAVEMTKQPPSCDANEAPVCDVFGFDSSFTSTGAGWTPISGSWFYQTGYAQTTGASNKFATLGSDNSYGDFEFTASMRRYGCATCDNGIVIRGTPMPLQTYDRWNTDYAFLYERDGTVSVWKRRGANEVSLLSYTTSGAVNLGDSWNTMKIIANRNHLYYYLNDNLVWSGIDYSYSYGKVGLTMYRNDTSTGDRFQVDWATLAGGTPLPLFSDSFEEGLEFWTHSASVGTNGWSHDTSYATAGNYELHGYDQPSESDSNVRMKNPIPIPAGQNTFLRFRHAFDFQTTDSTINDGGVIEYSTNDGSTWSDAASLVVNNGYNKTLSDSLGNPLGGRSAFGAGSNGYISTRLNLTSLAGSSFLFRFRMGTDSSGDDLGWLIDEVQMYTCMERGEFVHLPMLMHSEAATGFDSQFTDSNPGWQAQAGAWTVNGGAMGTGGIPNAFASISYWQRFANLDYSVRMRRSGCSSCANQILVRGDPLPLQAGRDWRAYYSFQYRNDGQYSVYKRVDSGASVSLQAWTSSPAIVSGGYNLLRVVANGTSLSFYINDTLVWSGADAELSNGQVGIGMYRDSYSEGNWLDVDYATLTNGSALLQADQISAEQQALNSSPIPGGSVEMAPER